MFVSEFDPETEALVSSLMTGVKGLSTAFSLVLSIFILICFWKLFTKAGEKGWKTLIPIYNTLTEYKLCWKTKKGWQWLLETFFGVFLIYIGAFMMIFSLDEVGALTNPTLSLVGLILIVLAIVLLVLAVINSIKLNVRLAKAYGQESAFAVGLIFLPVIFLAILAFGKSEYEGPQA